MIDDTIRYFKTDRSEKDFLTALKKALIFAGSDFYQLPVGMSLSEVESKHDIQINMHTLLENNNFPTQVNIFRYAIASCYNAHDTAEILEQRQLRELEKHGEITINNQRRWDSPKIELHHLFGSACQYLCPKSKELLHQLMVRYPGW